MQFIDGSVVGLRVCKTELGVKVGSRVLGSKVGGSVIVRGTVGCSVGLSVG